MAERRTLKISAVRKEGDRAKTLYFETDLPVKPGQFFMVADYEGGEKPISVSEFEGGRIGITVKEAGPFTRRLAGKEPGDLISLRGAYGSSFFISPGKVLLVGGGCGTAPLHFLARTLVEAGAEVTVVNGAKSRGDLIFGDRFAELPVEYFGVSEDEGEGLTAVETAKRLLDGPDRGLHYDRVYAAGPERMLVNLRPLLGSLPYQFLMERYMKCGVGMCGSCVCDPLGIRMCVEGPVLGRELVERLDDFGVYKRDAAGNKIKI